MKALSKPDNAPTAFRRSAPKGRITMVLFGLLIFFYGFSARPEKILGYTETSHHQVVFPGGVMAMGLLIACLALVPDRLVERLTRIQKPETNRRRSAD
jgi:peptidoglycan/LPS O-acetylase OafA/YrhL